MKKLFSVCMALWLCFGLVGCSSGDNKDNVNEEEKILTTGDMVSVKDDKGNELYSFVIDSVKNAPDFEYADKFEEGVQIIEVTYTYKNLSDEYGNAYIEPQYVQVANESGEIGEVSYMLPKGQPVETAKGYSCTVNAYYGIKGNNEKVKIHYQSESFIGNFDFESPIE